MTPAEIKAHGFFTRTERQHGNMAADRQNRFPGNYALIAYFLRGSRRYFLASMILAVLVAVSDMFSPKVIEFTVDSVIGDKAPAAPEWVRLLVLRAGGIGTLRQKLYLTASAIAVLALVSAVFRYLFRLMNTKGAEQLIRRMRDELYTHIQDLPYAWFGQNHTGEIIQRCTSDVETVKVFVSEQLTALFQVSMLIGLSMYFMAGIHRGMAAVEAVFIPLVVLASVVFYGRIGRYFGEVDETEAELSEIVQENLTGVRVVRAFGREAYERDRFQKKNETYTGLWIRLMRNLSAFWVAGETLSYVRNMVMAVLGAVFCIRGSLTAGEYLAFISYNALITTPVRRLGRMIMEMSKAGVSIGRIREIMNAEAEERILPGSEAGRKPGCGAAYPAPGGDRAENCPEDISFRHVFFRYPGTEEPVLRDISVDVPAGSTTGILGTTGSGKSTLLYLLDRLYDLPEKDGMITIGGKDIRTLDRHALRSRIGLVLQEPFLFSGTLRENITIARPDASDEEIRQAVRAAGLEETIASFPAGLETVVGERGVTLSGGQRQRTAIAQMLIRKPAIMIFDDALSAVDAETDARIRGNLKTYFTGNGRPTVFLIAHRAATLRHADQILVMDEGRIRQRGTHEELIRQDGMYRSVWRMQSGQTEYEGEDL